VLGYVSFHFIGVGVSEHLFAVLKAFVRKTCHLLCGKSMIKHEIKSSTHEMPKITAQAATRLERLSCVAALARPGEICP